MYNSLLNTGGRDRLLNRRLLKHLSGPYESHQAKRSRCLLALGEIKSLIFGRGVDG